MPTPNSAAAPGAPAGPNSGPGKNEIPFRERATCRINQACAATGLGRTLLYELIGENLVQSKMVKGRCPVNVPSLLKAVGLKPTAETGEVQ